MSTRQTGSRSFQRTPGSGVILAGPPGMGGSSSTDATLTDKDMRALQGLDSIQYKEGEISGSEKVKYLGQTQLSQSQVQTLKSGST